MTIISGNPLFHRFKKTVSSISLPRKFTYPFHYTPHPLAESAAKEVQSYLARQTGWKDELKKGKMFGVLVVQTDEKEMGFLAAFSGILAGKNIHDYFVPPIYDLLEPQGFFKTEEDQISAINAQINTIQSSTAYQVCKQELKKALSDEREALAVAKENLKSAKVKRDSLRKNNPAMAVEDELIRESQFQKAEFKRLKQKWQELIVQLKNKVEEFDIRIESLKAERKNRSAALQLKLFEQFRILNARGEVKDLPELFRQTVQKIPPAGAGECAAPKLLQYAYLHRLHPVAMAEFWWGDSPKTEIRHHGYYYPACKSKCEPILKHMLQGLDVETNPLSCNLHKETELEILFEDEWLLVVNKPAGMLSVPGKADIDSIYQRVKIRYPDATGPMIVHRLDMATSGLLLVAKTKEVHQNLQAQFKNRTIKKRYIALLSGIIRTEEGTVNLPLCLDPEDRPRQIVNFEYGKPAVTFYQVLARNNRQTRIAFFPQTGRTHQLRIHAAHPKGLYAPIVGDELYGKKDSRLFLHAEYLAFKHPVTRITIEVEKKADF